MFPPQMRNHPSAARSNHDQVLNVLTSNHFFKLCRKMLDSDLLNALNLSCIHLMSMNKSNLKTVLSFHIAVKDLILFTNTINIS